MNTIYKYPLTSSRVILELPSGAQVLTVQMQHGEPVLWALVDTSKPKTQRAFDTFGTGDCGPDNARYIYVATYQIAEGALVLHVFEAVPEA